MYCLSDQQIDYILNDISARGVEMESLQHNLLDHVCCIIEQNLEANGDFESFYQKSIKSFYKDELWEIEEETLQLLIFKNYYTMKKVMIISGLFSAAAMSLGITFKFMHWPGASLFIQLGIIASSFIFLPLLFILKSKEQENTKDKLVLGLGILSGILMSLSILFRVMHWPYGFNLAIISITILGLVFLPIYFFNGIRNPEKKINTIVFSIVIIMICGLWLTLVVSSQGVRENNVRNTTNFLTNERIFNNEKNIFESMINSDSVKSNVSEISQKIISQCDELKSIIIEFETGTKTIGSNFEANNQYIRSSSLSSEICQLHENKIMELTENVKNYNSKVKDELFKIPVKNNIIEYFPNLVYFSFNTLEVLNQLTQIQLIVLQNERALISKI